MRGILIDWLVQVHLRFHLLQETLYLTVAIIDRFLEVIDCLSFSLYLTSLLTPVAAGLCKVCGYMSCNVPTFILPFRWQLQQEFSFREGVGNGTLVLTIFSQSAQTYLGSLYKRILYGCLNVLRFTIFGQYHKSLLLPSIVYSKSCGIPSVQIFRAMFMFYALRLLIFGPVQPCCLGLLVIPV